MQNDALRTTRGELKGMQAVTSAATLDASALAGLEWLRQAASSNGAENNAPYLARSAV
jgi:hypothetical protein